MSSRRVLTLMLAFTPLWMAACDGCASREEEMNVSRKPMEQFPQFHVKMEDLGPMDVSVLRYAGKVDFGNRYVSAVMVTTGNPEDGARCSGVLISPRLALTAGSCVCKPRPVALGAESGFAVDGTACAERAHVVTVVYGRKYDAYTADMELQSYEGVVRPYPELKVDLDARSSVVASHGDLAVIVLDTPVRKDISFTGLADSEVRDGEALVSAGYGHDEAVEQFVGQRYFRPNKAAQGAAGTGERFVFVDREVDAHANHGGWPCFREGNNGLVLQGVSSRYSPEGRSCVSTYFYRQWLHAEVEQAAGREVRRR